MDIATIIGFVFGLGLIIGAIVLQGDIVTFSSPASVMIVLGGTTAAVLINFSLRKVLNIFKLVKVALEKDTEDPMEAIEILVSFAEKARREGLLALEDEVVDLDNEFLKKGIQLVVDGTDPELVRNIMETKLTFIKERHSEGQSVIQTMGDLAPAFGMIGTLIGLVQMLVALDDPDAIGAGMATALLTTLYGVLVANLVFIPLAGKLEVKSNQEVIMKELMIEGLLSIQAGENPRIVREKLEAFLSPAETGRTIEEGAEEEEEEEEVEMAVGSNV